MLGYTRDPRLSRFHNNTVLEEAITFYEPANSDSSYLTLFMTIEPQLLVPEPIIQTV